MNREDWDLHTIMYKIHRDFPCSLVDKQSACIAGDQDSIPGSGRSVGEGNPLQYSCLENPVDRGVWQATVHGFARVGHDLATKTTTTKLLHSVSSQTK